MAGENDNPIETRVGSESVHSIELGEQRRDGVKPQAERKNSQGMTAEFEDGKVAVHQSDDRGGTNQQQAPEDGADTTGADTETTGDDKGEGGGAAEALPAFKADDPEVVAKYDAAYLTDKGSPNLAALSADWWKNAKRDPDTGEWSGGLNDGAYDFLESKGFSKEMVKTIEAGQIARQVQKEQAVYERAGGAEALQAAREWATKGQGYTEAQRQRYMAAISGSDQGAVDEQVDLLMSRYQKATGKGPFAQRRQTQVKPDRTISSGAGAGGPAGDKAEPYANYGEYSKALREAKKSNDQNALNETRRRLRASPWHTGG